MRETLKRLGKMSIGYGLVQWAGPLVSLIFTPIITRFLTPADYGVSDYILTIGAIAGTLASFALPQALTAHYNDRADVEWKRRVVGSTLLAAAGMGVAVSVGLLIGAPYIAQSAFHAQTYTPLFRILGAFTIFSVAGGVLSTAAQADLRVRWGMALSLTSLACTVGGNLLFIVALRLGVTGMILTPSVTAIATCLLALSLTRRLVGPPVAGTALLLLRSGAVLLPMAIAAWGLQLIDRLFLIHYVSTTDLGYYAIANKAASLIVVALAPIQAAWTPLALSMQDKPDAGRRLLAMARYLVAAALLGSLALGLFATEILIVLTRTAYLPAAPYVGLLTYIYIFGAMGLTLTIGGLITKQLASISVSVVAGAVVNVILNFILIPRFGVWGAVVATVVGYAVPTALQYWRIRGYLPMDYPMRLFLTALAAQVILMLVGLLIPPLRLPVRVALKLLVFAPMPFVLIMMGIITPFEVQQLWLFARHRTRLALSLATKWRRQ